MGHCAFCPAIRMVFLDKSVIFIHNMVRKTYKIHGRLRVLLLAHGYTINYRPTPNNITYILVVSP